MTGPETRSPGRRDEHKRRTRAEIEAAAMRLFYERGYDQVTVAEVAQAAGVSVATVFNYFPAKEDLFFSEVPEVVEALVRVIESCPPGQSVLGELKARLPRLLTADRGEEQSAEIVHFHAAVRASPELQRREQQVHHRRQQALAAALAAGVDPEVRFLAEVAAAQYIAVEGVIGGRLRAALAAGQTPGPALRELAPFIEEAFAALEHGLGPLPKAGAETGAEAGAQSGSEES